MDIVRRCPENSHLKLAQVRDLRVVPVDSATKQVFETQGKVALICGVSQYPAGSGLRPLKYAVRDADALAAALKAQGYLVKMLKEGEATRGIIRNTLRKLAGAVEPDQGALLFFFGGHGFAMNGVNYLAPTASA